MDKNTDSTKENKPRSPAKSYHYEMGLDAGLNGANTTNCSFGLFSSRENTHEWEAGYAEGKRRAIHADHDSTATPSTQPCPSCGCPYPNDHTLDCRIGGL